MALLLYAAFSGGLQRNTTEEARHKSESPETYGIGTGLGPVLGAERPVLRRRAVLFPKFTRYELSRSPQLQNRLQQTWIEAEIGRKLLKNLVGARGFEPPTPCAQARRVPSIQFTCS